MLKTAEPRKGRNGVGGNSKAGRGGSEIDDDEVDSSKIEVDEVGKKVQKTTKSKNLSKSKKAARPADFFISGAKLPFIKLS